MIEKAQQGDIRAMELLVQQHQGAVYAFLAQWVGAEVAKDLTQESFVKAFRAIPGYSDQGMFRAWLFKIARNCGKDYLRQRQRRGGEHVEMSEATVMAEKTEEIVASRELCEIAFELIGQLPEAEREVMHLRAVEGLKFREIAEITATPLNTVLGRMRNATNKMRQWMQDYQ